MALPSSGEITFANVNDQLKRSTTAAINLNDTQVRGLAGKASGAISMSDLRGKWAGSRLQCASQADGTVGFKYNGAGSFTGDFAGAEMAFITRDAAGQYLFRTHDNQPKPTSVNVTLRDNNFAAVGSFTLSAWVATGVNGWYSTASPGTNYFPSGAVRWVTWN